MQRLIAITLMLGGIAAAAADTTLFRNVDVVPMTNDVVIEQRDVLVEDDIITRIAEGGEVEPPDGARVVEGSDRYLMPGIGEMHAHIPGADAGEQRVKDVLFLFLANGVTTIRGMLGEPYHLRLRQEVADGEVLGPRIYTSGPSLNGNTVDSPAHAARKVRAQRAAGYDFIKQHPGLTADEFRAMARAARSLDMPFAGHISRDMGLAESMLAGQVTIDHLEGFIAELVPPSERVNAPDPGFFGFALTDFADRNRLDLLAQLTAASGTWAVPTDTLMAHVAGPQDPEELADRPEYRFVPEAELERWKERKAQLQAREDYSAERARRFLQLRLDIIAALQDAGAQLLLGSDAPQMFNVPGFSIHRELDRLIEAGLSPYEALRTGTVNVAGHFGAREWYGTVNVGLAADLILLASNPLESVDALEEPVGVMVRGRWLDRSTIDERLEAIAERAAGGD